MSTLKVRCPECDAAVRKTIDPVEEPTEFTITCPRCYAEFVAEAQPTVVDAKRAPAKKPLKATRRRADDDDDDDNDRPRKRRKKAGPNPALLYGGIAAGVLALGGIVVAVIALSSSKDKEQAKADPPAKVDPQTPPGPAPSRRDLNRSRSPRTIRRFRSRRTRLRRQRARTACRRCRRRHGSASRLRAHRPASSKRASRSPRRSSR